MMEFSPVGAKRTSTGCPAPRYAPDFLLAHSKKNPTDYLQVILGQFLKYISKSYNRINLTVPKGYKAEINIDKTKESGNADTHDSES